MNRPSIGDSLYDDRAPLAVRFPLRGEWFAANSPADRIPSHGTDQLGQRFAYDFVQADDMRLAGAFWPGMRYFFGGGLPMSLSKGLGTPIYAPVSGKVIAAKDGWPERRKATPLDQLGALTIGMRLTEEKLRADYRRLTGNYIIIEGEDAFCFLAHATTGSIRVDEGDQVEAGEHIAKVGNTGNSTAPHLHFHLMDGPDLWTAKGLPCCFEKYEQFEDDIWRLVENGIPGRKDQIRAPTAIT